MLLLNNQPIDRFMFPGGEIQVKLPEKIDTERVVLTWKPIDALDIVLLQLTVNALKHMGINDIDLDVLYLPYARQDRVCQQGEACSLEVICEILVNLKVSIIRLWDVHNPDKTDYLLRDARIVNIWTNIIFDRYELLKNFTTPLMLCAPDKGAWEKVSNLQFTPIIKLHKIRNPKSGAILVMAWDKSNRDLEGEDVLVVDDICDGGSTFNQTAQILREHGAGNLYLYVTHGIFSKGLDLLQENFKHIYCNHVLHDDKFQSTDRLTILREFPHVP